jgi:hypothetical protein
MFQSYIIELYSAVLRSSSGMKYGRIEPKIPSIQGSILEWKVLNPPKGVGDMCKI